MRGTHLSNFKSLKTENLAFHDFDIIYLTIFLSFQISVYLSIYCIYFFVLSIYLYIHLSNYPSINV